MPHDSEWARTILEPLVVAAGYTVLRDGDQRSDVRILIDEDPSAQQDADAALIHLRSSREARGAEDNSIYRYDREALLKALASLRRENAA